MDVDCTSALPSPFWSSRINVLPDSFAYISNCRIGDPDYDDLEERLIIGVYWKGRIASK